MRNREENTPTCSDNIKTIKQRYYKAIDRFGEIHKLKLIIPENSLQKSQNFDVEFDANANLSMKCVYFPYIDEQKPKNPEIEDITPLVRVNFNYLNKRIIDIRINLSGIITEINDNKYLRYFNLKDYFSIPGDYYTELKDVIIDIKNSPIVKFDYNDSGLKTKEINISSESLIIETTEFNYTIENKIKDVTTIDEDSVIKRKIIYNYDDEGLLMEIKDYGFEGLFQNRTEYIYRDESSVLKQITIYNNEGKIDYQYFFGDDEKLSHYDRYDKQSYRNRIKSTYYYKYHNNGNYEIFRYYTESRNLFTQKVFNIDNRLIAHENGGYRSQYSYNSNGLKTEEISSGQQIDKIIYKYKYDTFNNWIECISYRNEIPFEIKTREISYF
jgi:hypothetical protein